MITAIVLVHVAADRIPEAAQAIADLDGVDEVYSCAGDVDLIAMVKVAQHEQLADVIAGRLSKVDGVRSTDTHIAFRSWSRADTEATFDVGLDTRTGVNDKDYQVPFAFNGKIDKLTVKLGPPLMLSPAQQQAAAAAARAKD